MDRDLEAKREVPGAAMGPYGIRQSGRQALLDAISRKRRQLDQLEALARAIPENFPENADAGLWELVHIHSLYVD